MEMRADLLIVGAGMVGSALALALKDSGLKILLLDGGSLSVKPFAGEAPFEPRVSALSAASQRILQRLGAWDGITRRRASPYSHMHVWDGSGTGQIHFSAASVHAEVLGHIVENRVVQTPCWSACRAALSRCWPMRAWSRCAALATTGC